MDVEVEANTLVHIYSWRVKMFLHSYLNICNNQEVGKSNLSLLSIEETVHSLYRVIHLVSRRVRMETKAIWLLTVSTGEEIGAFIV